MKKLRKRILKVSILRMIDECPDTSHMGEYASSPANEFSIDRAHAEDCRSLESNHREALDKLERILQHLETWHNEVLAQYNGTLANETLDAEKDALSEACDTIANLQTDVQECDCNKGGRWDNREYRYFNPSFNYVTKTGKPADGLTPDEVRKYTRQDYDRMERLGEDWSYIGIRAQAEIGLPSRFPDSLTIQRISSGGLWGIESDSDKEYIASVAADELSDLKAQLKELGFSARSIAQAFKDVKDEDE